MLDALWQDLRYAVRALRSSPGFAAVSILSLALGIGANTAIFSLIDAVMLKSLPVNHPEELLQVTMGTPEFLSNPIWEQIRDGQDVFQAIFGYGRWAFNLAAGGEARPVNGYFVSGQFFETLGVHAVLGRTLTPADDRRGCAGGAVLSYGFWQREYGGRGNIIGQTISINSHPMEIVGVAEPRFTGVDVGSWVDVLAPLCAEKALHGELNLLDTNNIPGWLQVIGRPKPGVSASQAEARLKTLAPEIYRATVRRTWQPEDQDRYLQRTLAIQPASNGLSYLRRQYRQGLTILMAMVAVVLLIACANVANLLLARGAARQREMAIRMALGSPPSRLIRQLLTESLLLAAAGAGLGALFARWGARLLVVYLGATLDLAPDARVLAFTAGAAVLTGLLFGIVPAWRGTRVAPQAAMKANSRGVAEGPKFGIGKALVTVQVALSLVLVAGAGLLLSTFWNLASLDAGFERDHVLLTSADLSNGSDAPERPRVVFRQVLEKLRAIPGVRSASASNIVPMCGCKGSNELVIEGYTAKSRDDVTVLYNRVSDRYFETLGTPIVAGRDFNDSDTPGSPKLAIINQTMARRYFGTANPLGRRFRIREGNEVSEPFEITGIVADAKYGALREEISPTAYTARSQAENTGPVAYFQLRASGGVPTALIAGVKTAFAELDRGASLEFTTLAGKIDRSLTRERLMAMLSGFFGALALLLATIGLYGVMSYNVARRRNEIGIRMALGAEQARVLRMVLGEVALLIGIGLLVGLGAAVATTRFVASFLYGLPPNDPLTLSLAAAVLGGSGFRGWLFAGAAGVSTGPYVCPSGGMIGTISG